MSTRLILCGVVLLCIGCDYRLPKEEVYGEYEADARNGTLKLVLNRDMTDEQSASFNGRSEKLTGNWSYDSSKGRLEFQKMFATEETKDYKSDEITGEIDAGASLPVYKSFGHICISLDPNTDACYTKIKSK